MPSQEVLNIDVVAADISDCKVFFGTVVEAVIRKNNIIHDNEVTVSMTERGKELLFDAERYEEAVRASRRADNYALKIALDSPESVEDSMEISFMCKDTFCGRVNFRCNLFEDYYSQTDTDAVLVIADSNKSLPDHLSVFTNVPITGAVYTDSEECDADTEFKRYVDAVDNVFLNKELLTGIAYNPLGFSDGKINPEDEAEPYGTEEIFWNVVKNAALHGIEFYHKGLANSLKEIKRSRNVFCKKSSMRQIELGITRDAYVITVSALYSIENLLSLINGEL